MQYGNMLLIVCTPNTTNCRLKDQQVHEYKTLSTIVLGLFKHHWDDTQMQNHKHIIWGFQTPLGGKVQEYKNHRYKTAELIIVHLSTTENVNTK